jgi:hypothetical protein
MFEWISSNKHWIFSGIGVFMLAGLGRILIRRFTRASESRKTSGDVFFQPRVKPSNVNPYDVLPHTFEVWLRQQIPHIDIWVYVVNYQSREVRFTTFNINNFHLSGGPALGKIPSNDEVLIPANSASLVLCRRNLIDTEARAVENTSYSIPVNATFSIICRATKGRNEINREISSLSMNGWLRGLPSTS